MKNMYNKKYDKLRTLINLFHKNDIRINTDHLIKLFTYYPGRNMFHIN